MERHPRAKAIYASALLKAQLASRPLPLGCYWPAGTEHPLTERVEMLKRVAPDRTRRLIGITFLAVFAAGAGVGAWAAMPPEERVMLADPPPEAPAIVSPARTMPQQVTEATPFVSSLSGPQPEPETPQPIRDEPQIVTPAPEFKGLPWILQDRADASAPLDLRGVVAYVEWVNPATRIHVREDGTGKSWVIETSTPNTLLRLGVTKVSLQNGTPITARGFAPVDKTCADACVMYAHPEWMTFSGKSLSPPPSQTAPQPIRYEPQQVQPSIPVQDASLPLDADMPIYLRGRVEKIDFTDTTYIVFVRAENMAADPYSLAQPNSQLWALNPTNYFGDPDNRQRIHDSFVNKRIDVFGYGAADKSCTPACLIQDREILLQPANTGFEGGFAGLPGHIVLDTVIDTSAPIQLRGTVVRFDNAEESATPHGVLWVEAKNVEPATTLGAKPGTMWRVAGFPGHVLKSRFWLGAEVTVNGFNVRDKSCEPACVMVGKQILNGFSDVTTAN